jgi:hypothetical protein
MPPINLRKKYGYTASVAKGSNKVVACTKANWNAVQDNSFIIIGNDSRFYNVIDKKKFIYQKDVTVLNEAQLKVDDIVSDVINVDDDVSFLYTEYSVSAIEIVNGGSGYSSGDILTLKGGVLKFNSIDEINSPASIKVVEVNDTGGLSSIELTSGGLYSALTEGEYDLESGAGAGGKIKITPSTSDITSIEERTVTSIDINPDSTIISLNSNLPQRLTNGVVKVEKWELTLDKKYQDASKNSVDYDIVKDFTPHNNIPLIRSDLNSSHVLYNEAVAIIDQKIKDLEDKWKIKES